MSNFTEKYYTEFLAFIIHPLVTMLAKMNQTSAFSEGNSEAQVHRPPKTLNHEEWHHIMLYVLTNLVEVQPFIG